MSCQYSRVLQHIYAPQECQGTSAQGIDCLRGSATFRVKAGPQAVEASEAPSKSLASVVLFLEELRGRLQGPQGHMAETRLLSRLLWFLSEIEINYIYICICLMSNTKNLLYNYSMYIKNIIHLLQKKSLSIYIYIQTSFFIHPCFYVRALEKKR